MTLQSALIYFFASVFGLIGLSACGVKGPPQAPIPMTPQQMESQDARSQIRDESASEKESASDEATSSKSKKSKKDKDIKKSKKTLKAEKKPKARISDEGGKNEEDQDPGVPWNKDVLDRLKEDSSEDSPRELEED